MKMIVIEIHPDGSSTIDAQGFKGSQCSLATRDLEMALVGNGGNVESDRKKPDFYASNPTTQAQTNS